MLPVTSSPVALPAAGEPSPSEGPSEGTGADKDFAHLVWTWALQTIYNAITNGTPCVIVEGSGRVADVIAQVASLPVSEITICLIQQKLSLFFQEMFETFTESRVVEWTKKVGRQACSPQADPKRLLAWRDQAARDPEQSAEGPVGEG